MDWNKKQVISIIILNTPIPVPKTVVNLLGFTIDNKLNWPSHIEQKKMLSSSLILLCQLKNITGYHTFKIAYFSRFYFHISYGISLRGHSVESKAICVQ